MTGAGRRSLVPLHMDLSGFDVQCVVQDIKSAMVYFVSSEQNQSINRSGFSRTTIPISITWSTMNHLESMREHVLISASQHVQHFLQWLEYPWRSQKGLPDQISFKEGSRNRRVFWR